MQIAYYLRTIGASGGSVVVKVPGTIPGGVNGDDFRGSRRRNYVPWGRLKP